MGFQQGVYEVKNREKYIGRIDDKHPRYLSSYELHTFRFMDNHNSVLKWGSECVVIKYKNPAKRDSNGNPRICRYMVDLYVEYLGPDGSVIKELVEIKPSSELKAPVKRGRKRPDVFLKEQLTYVQNVAKWKAAAEYARLHGMRFRVITEKDIFTS